MKHWKRIRRAIVVPTYAEIALGTAQRQCEIVEGKTYDLAPHCDLWMRGATQARVKAIYQDAVGRITAVSVEPLVAGATQRGTFYIPKELDRRYAAFRDGYRDAAEQEPG